MRANPVQLHMCRPWIPGLRHYDAEQGIAPGRTTNRRTVTQRRSLREMRRTKQSHRQVDAATCTRRPHPSEIILQCTEDYAHSPLFPMFSSHEALEQFDSLLRSGLCTITNLAVSDPQWIQASLPVCAGGLGIRRVVSLALPAFQASAASTHSLQSLLLLNCHYRLTIDSHRERLMRT